VGPGRLPSSNGSAIWPPRHPRAGSGGRGMRGSASGLSSIMIAQMKRGGLPDACCARWTRSGCFWHSTALSRPITAPSAPCALVSSGGSGPRGRPAPRATAGWSGAYPSEKRVVSGRGLLTRYWWMLSPVCSKASSLTSPGSASVKQPFHTPVIAYRSPMGRKNHRMLPMVSRLKWIPRFPCLFSLANAGDE
jgi:hypothetical protein